MRVLQAEPVGHAEKAGFATGSYYEMPSVLGAMISGVLVSLAGLFA